MTQNISQVLERAGYRRTFALVLAYLIDSRNVQSTSREIERMMDMRQPEVSIALSQIIDRGWVTVTEREGTGEKKGRPVKLYQLVDITTIYTGIEKEIHKNIKESQKVLEELRVAMILPKSSGAGEHVLPGSTPVEPHEM